MKDSDLIMDFDHMKLIRKNLQKRKSWFFFSIPFFIVLFSLFLLLNSPQNTPSEQIFVYDADFSTPRMLSTGTPPQGYNESDFILLEINENNIVLDDEVIITDESSNTISCYTNLTSYPQTGTLWHIRLPSSYPDAKNYVIRRGATEVFYCFYDNEIHQLPYQGVDTYWQFPASELTRDILRFDISSPVTTIEDDFENSTQVDYVLEVSRLINSLRTYTDVMFDVDFAFPFETDFDIRIFDETGGDAFVREITNDVNLVLLVKQPASQFEPKLLNVRFTLGTILSNTDYKFRIQFYTVPTPPSFFSDWIINIVMPVIGGFLVGLTLYPVLWSYIKRPQRIKLNGKDFMKYGLVTCIFLTGMFMLIMWSSWNRSYANAVFFPMSPIS